jgi:two-component system, cell cycle sensor histidine kinase and response regulator CckA
MNLRKKALLIVSLTAVALILIMALASQIILMRSFLRLEQQATQKDVGRVQAALTDEIAGLDSTVSDWAAWDDTYRFVADQNLAYQEGNLADDTFVNLNLSLMLFVDTSGRIVHGKAYDRVKQAEVALPADLPSLLASDPVLLHHPDANSSATGIILLMDGPVMVASRPIVTSKAEGPIRGTLIVGRNLDEHAISGLAQRLLFGVSMYRMDEPDLPADVRAAAPTLGAAGAVTVRALNEGQVAGYSRVDDTAGKPILVLRVDEPRAIYRQGQLSIAYMLGSLLVVGLAFGGATWWLLETQILRRVSVLSGRVRGIGVSQDLSARVAVSGGDELASLADSINDMLAQIEQSQAALHDNEGRLNATIAALGASEANYRSIFDTANDAVFVHDAMTGQVLDMNEEACRAYGWARDEAVNVSVADLCSGDTHYTPDRALDYLNLAANGEPQVFEWLAKNRSGRTFWTEVSLKRVDIGGRRCVLAIVRDISERKRLEAQFLQSQKMETIGRLAGGVAHDFNNLLTAISGYAALARKGLKPDDPAAADVDQVLKDARRAAGLTRQLLAFSRQQVITPQVLNLNSLVLEMDKMLRRLIGEHIELTTIPGSKVGLVRIDPVQVEQVLVNLAVNARDAMPHGGKLTIGTARVQFRGDHVRGQFETSPGGFVMLAVTDTGTGMSDEVKSHLFEPFFTTKDVGKGTGLGLATVYGIVKQNHGDIRVYSEPGQGTSFKIYLPCYDGLDDPAAADQKPEVPRGTETVLVVEDEPAVRSVAVRSLREVGYVTLEAAGGDEALEVAAGHAGPIHLLLTDVVMPRMSGKSLADQIKASRPDIKILFMSGYAESGIVHQGVLDDGIRFLQKPFTGEALAIKTREVLDGRCEPDHLPGRDWSAPGLTDLNHDATTARCA